jgi:hypothetical protein
MLTPPNCCIQVALCIDAQLVVSIGQKADPAPQSLGFRRGLLAEGEHKRPVGHITLKYNAVCR